MRPLPLALALGLLLGAAGEASAFVRTHVDPESPDSPCLFWGRRSVPFQIVGRGSQAAGADEGAIYEAIRVSMQQWTNVGCSDFTYDDRGLTDSLEVGFNRALLNQPSLAGDVDPRNTILFRNRRCSDVAPASDPCFDKDNDDCDSVYDCWNYGDGVIALTTTTYSFQSGQLFDGDIELNEAEFTFTTVDGTPCVPHQPIVGCVSTDVRNTVTHEAGHLLGLGHSPDANATMYFSASTGEVTKRDLGDDDVSALCTIYPSGQPPLTCNEPGPSQSGCGCGSVDAVGFAPLAMLLLLRRRRGSSAAGGQGASAGATSRRVRTVPA